MPEVVEAESYLTPSEVVKLLPGTKLNTWAIWRIKGCGPRFVKVHSRSVVYPRSEVEKFIRERTVSNTAEGKARP